MNDRYASKHDGEAIRRERAMEAIRALRTADKRLRALIDRIGPYRPDVERDPFAALVSSIIQQQVSMTAAAAIGRRVRDLLPRGRFTPRAILEQSDGALRTAGLSRQKTQYLKNVARAFAARELTPARLRRWSDDEVIHHATRVKGIGRWTAEMLLIFCLERPDVWPIDDLGLRRAVAGFLERAEPPPPDELLALAEPWRPYRSYATWYLWRSLEGPLMPGTPL